MGACLFFLFLPYSLIKCAHLVFKEGVVKMIYTFDVSVAKEYGVNEAIMIANFQFWIAKNKANDKNYFDGHYWTYNSKRAFLELFPFWSEQNIKTILRHLKDQGVIITGNYNKNNYDRTLWYAFADDNTWLNDIKQNNTSLSENQPIDKLELTNGEVGTNQPIPDIIPNIKTDKKENKNNKLFLLKKGYGEFGNVKLTKEEILNLAKKYKWRLGEAIARLDDYMEAKGDKYKSHYAVLKEQGWVWKDVFGSPDTNGKPKDILRMEDDSVPGGMRAETPVEYYTRVYKLDE